MQRVGRLHRARFVKAFLQAPLWKRGEAEARCDQFALRRLARSERRLKREARSGIEGPEFAFIVELAPPPPLAAGWLDQRAVADKADARILIADEFGARTRLDGEERCLSTIGARGAQESVAREDGVKGTHEHGLDMHAGEIEIFRVSARLVAGDLAETGETQSPRPA